MKSRLAVILLATGAVVAGACGGGGSEDLGPASASGQLTDPATVPSSTPISADNMTFFIRDNGVSAPDGASTVVTGSTPSGGAPARATYEIRPGDLCSTIADEFGITVDLLLDLNPGTECNALIPGTELRVPGEAEETATPSPETTPPAGGDGTPTPGSSSGGTQYEIKPGDICVDIAAQFGVSVDDLVAANGLDCGNLTVGEVITIP